MLLFVTLVSIASVIFVGGSSTRGPKGTYSVPEAGGIRMGIFTIVLTAISLPMTILINRYVMPSLYSRGLADLSVRLRTAALTHRSIITPYKLPLNPQTSLRVLLSSHELSKPFMLYLTPGLLATTLLHTFCVTILARTVRTIFLGSPHADPMVPEAPLGYYDVAYWRWALFLIYQAGATAYLAPLEVIATRLSVQPNTGGFDAVPGEEESIPEGVSYAGTDEDVIGLRPTTEAYDGLLDCARKIGEEEGWDSLFRGWWWTMGSNVFGVFSS